MAIVNAQLDNWFTYHRPTEGQPEKYEAIRNAGRALAQVIVDNTPPSADQTTAIRKIREAVMTANAAIACDGHGIALRAERSDATEAAEVPTPEAPGG